VVALNEADFGRWLNDSRRELEVSSIAGRANERGGSLAGSGEQVAARYGCLRCHTVDGSPHIGPTWAGLYGSLIPLRDGKTAIADVAYLTESMMDPQSKMHAGYDPVMPSYIGLLKPPEVGALVEYIKALQQVPVEGGPAVAAAPTGAPNRLPPLAPDRTPEPAGEPGPPATAARRLPDAPRNDRALGLPAAGAQIYPPPRQVSPSGLEREMLKKVQGATAQNGAEP
jgi:cytochrome c oxidase subunit 2